MLYRKRMRKAFTRVGSFQLIRPMVKGLLGSRTNISTKEHDIIENRMSQTRCYVVFAAQKGLAPNQILLLQYTYLLCNSHAKM